MHVPFSFAFSSTYAKIRTSNFHNLVRQHTEDMVGRYEFCWKSTSLSVSERISKIRYELTKLSP